MIYLYLTILSIPALLVCYIGYAFTTGYLQKFFMLIGAPIDVFVNATWGSLLYWSIPKNLLLTQTTIRLKTDTGFRGVRARLMCRFLNWIKKDHCHD